MVCDWRWWRHSSRITRKIHVNGKQRQFHVVPIRQYPCTRACTSGSFYSALKSMPPRVNVCQHQWMACLSTNSIDKGTTFDLYYLWSCTLIIITWLYIWHVDTVVDVYVKDHCNYHWFFHPFVCVKICGDWSEIILYFVENLFKPFALL